METIHLLTKAWWTIYQYIYLLLCNIIWNVCKDETIWGFCKTGREMGERCRERDGGGREIERMGLNFLICTLLEERRGRGEYIVMINKYVCGQHCWYYALTRGGTGWLSILETSYLQTCIFTIILFASNNSFHIIFIKY